MSYGPTSFQDDSDALQTDVMRFMAIIAFCLIAILALVKEAAPTSPFPTPVSDTAAPPIEPLQVSSAPPAAVTPRWEQPLPRPSPEPATPRPTPNPDVKVRQQPKPPARQEAAVLPTPPASAISDEGLSLRFASDNDFLRLIAKGDISVYAYHGPQTGGVSGKEILKLDGNYQFRESPAPGRVYELLPQTIPGLVINALQTTGRNIEAFTWAIVLPPRIEAQLEQHMTRVRTGELVIDRFGEVQHVVSG